jgi:hypothetical protein
VAIAAAAGAAAAWEAVLRSRAVAADEDAAPFAEEVGSSSVPAGAAPGDRTRETPAATDVLSELHPLLRPPPLLAIVRCHAAVNETGGHGGPGGPPSLVDEPCKNFVRTGECMYGDNCRYVGRARRGARSARRLHDERRCWAHLRPSLVTSSAPVGPPLHPQLPPQPAAATRADIAAAGRPRPCDSAVSEPEHDRLLRGQ